MNGKTSQYYRADLYVEKYLRQCLDSILRQTFRPLEIILVNDGSTDGSDTICQNMQKLMSNCLSKKENGGVSDARNVGLDAVTSDYVLFIDSDDWIEPTYVEVLYEKIEEYQADIVFKIIPVSTMKIPILLPYVK